MPPNSVPPASMQVEQALKHLAARTDAMLQASPLVPGPELVRAALELVGLATAVVHTAADDPPKTSSAPLLPGEAHFREIIQDRRVDAPSTIEGEQTEFDDWLQKYESRQMPYWMMAVEWISFQRRFHARFGMVLEPWMAAHRVHMRVPRNLRFPASSRIVKRSAGDFMCETPSNRKKTRDAFQRVDDRIPFCSNCWSVMEMQVFPEPLGARKARFQRMAEPGWQWEEDDVEQ